MINIFSSIDIDTSEIDVPKTEINQDAITNVLQIVFGIFASVAVLIIVIAGLYFVLSRGNPEKAGQARNAIIYAAIGLVIALSAFSIVAFVIGGVT